MLYLLAFLAGGFFGIVLMCLIQINAPNSDFEYRMEQDDSKNKEGRSL